MTRTAPLRVAVLGCGSVGSQVVRLLAEQAGDLAARIGAPIELVGVAVRRIDAPREVVVPRGSSPPTPTPWSPATTWTSWSR